MTYYKPGRAGAARPADQSTKPMKKLRFLLFGALALSLAACGGNSEKSNDSNDDDEKMEERSSGAQSSGEPKNMQEAMAQAQEAMKNMQTAEPVNFRDLQDLLSEKLAGFERKSRSGETSGAMGFTISRAEARYEDGDRSANVEIMDTGGITGVAGMGLVAWSMATIDREDDEGYERTSTLDGYKSLEKYYKSGNRSELSILIGNRFVINANGDDCSLDELKKLVKAINLKKLEKMG